MKLVTALVLAAASLPSGGCSSSHAPGDTPVLVDPGALWIHSCGLSVVSFRTREEGWVADRCGNVYRSHDAGLSWARDRASERAIFGPPPEPEEPDEDVADTDPEDGRFHRAAEHEHLEFLRWLSPTEGIAGGYIGAKVMRTADGGRSWTPVPLPSDQWIYSVAVAGDAVWVCGSSGAIARSADRGRTWRAIASPFDEVERCFDLEFDAAGRGSGVGTHGSRWTTEDGGHTWSHDPGSPTASEARRRVLEGGVAHGEPGAESRWGRGTVRLADGVLVFEEPGKPRRVQPLVRGGAGKRVPLLAREKLGERAYGHSGSHLHFAEDAVTWYARSKLPAPAVRVTFVNEETVILESADGVFRSPDGGETWARSTQGGLDRSDAERVRAGGRLPGVNPFACVAASPDAELHVVLEVRGCFGGTTSTLDLVTRSGASSLTGLVDHGAKSRALDATPIDAAERRRIVDALGDAVVRLEEPLECWSTNHATSHITWRCAGAGAVETSLVFEGSMCGEFPEGVGAGTTAQVRERPGYARANGIQAAARAILERHGAP